MTQDHDAIRQRAEEAKKPDHNRTEAIVNALAGPLKGYHDRYLLANTLTSLLRNDAYKLADDVLYLLGEVKRLTAPAKQFVEITGEQARDAYEREMRYRARRAAASNKCQGCTHCAECRP